MQSSLVCYAIAIYSGRMLYWYIALLGTPDRLTSYAWQLDRPVCHGHEAGNAADSNTIKCYAGLE